MLKICRAACAIFGLFLAWFGSAPVVAQDAAAEAPESRPAPAAAPDRPSAKRPAPKKPLPKPVRTNAGSQKNANGTAPAAPAPAPAAIADPNTPAPNISPSPQAAAPVASAEPIGELEPVLHARNAKLTTCMDNVIIQAGRTIDRPHKALSTWVTSAPNDNVFQSIVGLTYPNTDAPNGLAIFLAAPLGPSKCEGQGVQVYPTALACTKVQANLLQSGHTVASLGNLPVVETKGGTRSVLMPTAGGGCVIVSVHLQ